MIHIQAQALSNIGPSRNHRHGCSTMCIFTSTPPKKSILFLFPNYDKFSSRMTFLSTGNPPRTSRKRTRTRTRSRSGRDKSTFSASAATGSPSQQPDEVTPSCFGVFFHNFTFSFLYDMMYLRGTRVIMCADDTNRLSVYKSPSCNHFYL